MSDLLGERLISDHEITEEQLKKALERQRMHGGRLGDNMVALGFISADQVDDFFRRTPKAPRTVEESGLNTTFISQLIMKHALTMGEFNIPAISARIKLPAAIVDQVIEDLRNLHLVEVKGAGQLTRLSYQFALTELGKKHASELMDVSRYVGPAPVPFDDYKAIIQAQTIKSILVSEESVKAAFSHLVLNEEITRRIGPSVSSGKAIFLYGPSGNGKTTIAETIGRVLPGQVYVPYSVIVGGEIIMVFDKVTHIPVEPENNETVDQRWVLTKRPFVMVGGELTLKELDLDFNPIAKFYEAPLQMKANNGLFLVDDFGRQQVDPQKLLNRWIVPLERRTDFLTLHTGMKFEIPFDQLVIFSTNLEPKSLVDEAFLRRIRYKIKIDSPSQDEYEKIFRLMCSSNGVEFNPDVFQYILGLYMEENIGLSSCHPRDLIDQIIDQARYHNRPPEMTRESMKSAWDTYFVPL